MTAVAIGLFPGFTEARHMIRPLVTQGIRSEDITIIANREETSISDVLAAAAWGVNVDVGPASQGQPAALIALGVPAEETRQYAMAIDCGGTFMSVVATEDLVDQACALMGRAMTADRAARSVLS